MSTVIMESPNARDIVPTVDEKNIADLHHLDDVGRTVDDKNLLREEADRAEVYEHNLSTWQAFKSYKAVSVVKQPYGD